MATGKGLKATTEQAERLHEHAHDLRNRLAAIQQVLVQLKEGSIDPAPHDLIEFAEQQYFRAMRATEQLLDDLDVQRGIGTLKLAPLDLAAMVNESVDSLQHRFERKAQVVSMALDPTIVVNGDAHWLRQLIGALLSNASKFTPSKGSIWISTERNEGCVVLAVRDNGIGLDAHDLQHVFVRYAWLHGRSTEGEAQGRSTLARAAVWAQAHGGSLTAASDGTGLGSTFSLRLPLPK